MSAAPKRVTAVVLSEDSGKTGWSSVHKLAKKTFDFMVDNLAWGTAIEMVPRGEVPRQVQEVCSGNSWNSTRAEDQARIGALFRYVADQLMSDDETPRFVLFHIDADRVWSERMLPRRDNLRKFDDVVRAGVRRVLMANLEKRRALERIESLMARLYTLVPYVEIEAWLYQATGVATNLCRQRGCGRHVEQYEAWAANRAQLDEIPALKEAGTEQNLHCLSDEDKDTLAAKFDPEPVYEANASYWAAVESLTNDKFLMDALKSAKWDALPT